MLLMVESVRGGICHAIYQYVNTCNKYMKNFDESKEPSYLKYWDVTNLYGWTMSQKLPVDGFKWIEETSQFNEGSIESYNKEIDGSYFLEVDVQYPEKLDELHNDLPFLPEIINM